MAMRNLWLIHFFQRHRSDDPERSVPAIDFLDSAPFKVRAEINADAVAEAPPPAFSGAASWEAMHDEMAGFYEVCGKQYVGLIMTRSLALPPRFGRKCHTVLKRKL